MSHRVRNALAVAVAGFVLAASALVAGPAGADAGWKSDGRSWSGTGAVFVPDAGHVGNGSAGSSGCDGCRWFVVPACGLNPRPDCLRIPFFRCAAGTSPFFVLFAPSASAPLDVVAVPCIGPGQQPMSERDFGRAVSARIGAEAPPVRLGLQPVGGAVTQLPTIFRSGQPRTVRRDDVIVGFSTRFVARARWTWTWGDGSVTTTSSPGGTWPNMAVTHVYRKAGRVRVRAETAWTASYWVDGRGPFFVDGPPVRQSASMRVPVRQARAVLTR